MVNGLIGISVSWYRGETCGDKPKVFNTCNPCLAHVLFIISNQGSCLELSVLLMYILKQMNDNGSLDSFCTTSSNVFFLFLSGFMLIYSHSEIHHIVWQILVILTWGSGLFWINIDHTVGNCLCRHKAQHTLSLMNPGLTKQHSWCSNSSHFTISYHLFVIFRFTTVL